MVDPRHSQIPTPIPPDYEDRHRLAHALCQHLGINPQHVLGSMQIELGPDQRHRITWTGSAHLNLNDLSALIHKAHHPDPDPEPRMRDADPLPPRDDGGPARYYPPT